MYLTVLSLQTHRDIIFMKRVASPSGGGDNRFNFTDIQSPKANSFSDLESEPLPADIEGDLVYSDISRGNRPKLGSPIGSKSIKIVDEFEINEHLKGEIKREGNVTPQSPSRDYVEDTIKERAEKSELGKESPSQNERTEMRIEDGEDDHQAIDHQIQVLEHQYTSNSQIKTLGEPFSRVSNSQMLLNDPQSEEFVE